MKYNIWASNAHGIHSSSEKITQRDFRRNSDNSLLYQDDKTIEIHTLEEFTVNIDCLADDELLVWNNIPFASYKEIDYEYTVD